MEDGGHFKGNQHEQGEQRVVPLFVHAPQGDTEDLKHKERRHGVLLEQLHERRDRDVKAVGAVVSGKLLQVALQAGGGLENFQRRQLVNLEFRRRKLALLRVEQVASLLVQE